MLRTFVKLSSTYFFSNVKIKIIYEKEVYFLHELLKDVSITSETHGLDETAIILTKNSKTVDLKKTLSQNLMGVYPFSLLGNM